MPTIKIRGQKVDVDIEHELREFDWTRARWTADKLIAASPFRYDGTPSFFVNLDGEYAGAWGDSGAYDIEWESGGFVKLLSFLRDETYEETEEYLLQLYSTEFQYGEELKLPKLSLKFDIDRHIDNSILENYMYRHPYLEMRGISEKVQRAMSVGYDKKNKAVTIPWFSADGRLANVKYRTTFGKTFWYYKGAEPIRNLIYGIDVIYKYNVKTAVICEAEIDAMTWITAQVPAIAIGGVNFTNRQADMIKRSPLERIVLCMDNDKSGAKLKRQIIDKLGNFVELEYVSVPSPYKDINEAMVGGEDLRKVYGTRRKLYRLSKLGEKYSSK